MTLMKDLEKNARRQRQQTMPARPWRPIIIARCMQRLLMFFFSSRRRHTRLQGDWSSDVCSSDLADVPEAQIDASPDLDFNVAGRRIEVTGKVAVPYAKIQPKDFAGAVRASPDEVIVGSEEEDPTKRLETMSTITLSLGERVNIDTSGLTGRLTGSITIRSGYDAITRATGELSVAEGKYTA